MPYLPTAKGQSPSWICKLLHSHVQQSDLPKNTTLLFTGTSPTALTTKQESGTYMMPILGCQLDTLGEKEPQTGDYLHYITLCMYEGFS